MLVVIPYAVVEIPRAKALLGWIKELDGSIEQHPLLLVASSQVTTEQIKEVNGLARAVFKHVTSIRQTVACEGQWPLAANAMFKTALEWVRGNAKGHWIWLETDAVPLCSGWLDKLDAEYRAKGKPFCGTTFDQPYRHLNGVMMYPQNPAAFNAGMLGATRLPWDLVRAEVTLKHGAVTGLIQRMLANPSKNLPMSFPAQESLSVIRSEAVLFHGVKDGSLIKRLMERGALSVERGAAKDKPGAWVGRMLGKLTKMAPKKAVYYHSGNLGDIIYSLYAIKLAGGGELIIGPTQKDTSPCSCPVNLEQFNRLAPLLRTQHYLREVKFSAQYVEGVIDLNRFRNLWFDLNLRLETGINTLCQMHCQLLGVADKFRHDEPWLNLDAPANGRVVISRSLRHRSWDFPYGQIIAEHGDKCVFIGHEQEHMIFELAWPKVEYWKVNDFLEMARLIAGSELFVGNQSFPMALALGLGVEVRQESYWPAPDCLFKRENFRNQKDLNAKVTKENEANKEALTANLR